MKRHSFNMFSLAFGLALIVLAAWIGFPARGWLFGTPRWLLPAVVILVGVVLMSPLFTSRASHGRDGEESGDVDRPMEGGQARPSEESTPEGATDEHDGASSDLATGA